MINGEERERRRRARDLERRMRELDDLDRRFGLGAMPGTTAPEGRRAPRARRLVGGWVTGLLTVALLAAVLALHPSAQTARDGVRRELARLGLGEPDAGSYAFLSTQPGTGEPVGYDPCSEVEVRVNDAGAPAGWEELVVTAIRRIDAASGLRLVYVGRTDDRGAAPAGLNTALVVWGTEEEFPELAGNVAGVGGSTSVQTRLGHRRYVSGTIRLDTDAFADLAARGGGEGRALAQATVDHEFGHLVGLDHVDDRGELMHPEGGFRTGWGPGDLRGLARLGEIECEPADVTSFGTGAR